jgi:hypothetical protein
VTGDLTREDAAYVVLAAQVVTCRLVLMRANVWPLPDSGPEMLGFLFVGPDDLEGVSELQGCAVWRVDHWQGDPVLAVPAGRSVADAYQVARVLQDAGVPPDRIRAFGPAGWEHVSLPLIAASKHRVDFVPVTKVPGPMIGVELT